MNTNEAKGLVGKQFEIVREYAAPRALVFKAWTDPAWLAKWWGPRGFTNPICDWDARPGRRIHVVMRSPTGDDYPMGGEFREVVPNERLAFTSGALGSDGAMLFEFMHVVTFEDRGGGTKLTVRSQVTTAGPDTGKYIGGFEAGMTQSLERLGIVLAAPIR